MELLGKGLYHTARYKTAWVRAEDHKDATKAQRRSEQR